MRLQRVFVASLRIPVLPHFSWFFESRNISSTPIVHQKAQLSLSDIVSQAPIHGNCGRTRIPPAAQLYFIPTTTVLSTVNQWCRYLGHMFSFYPHVLFGTPQRSGVGHVPISLREKAVLTMDSHADILLVEDEPDIVDLMERILRRAGYTVRAVTDGLAALTAMSVLPPAVMILDLVLPVMSGWAVLDELHCDQCQVPIIIMTANPCVSARLSGYGIQQYLVKPFLMDELLGSIADVYPLQRHR